LRLVVMPRKSAEAQIRQELYGPSLGMCAVQSRGLSPIVETQLYRRFSNGTYLTGHDSAPTFATTGLPY
jgi:hypothetical protein